ncbi:MAG: DNA polymerase IV [Candidatus Schekmanbacteria bacterium]|nr:MAG: DNA polymerase IV [Candidatus Schekmanbacteria bacterium]
MNDEPLSIYSWPRGIMHIDADAFFASCEQSVNPRLRGKPVITGKERGIVAAASYEAKAYGIKRGMTVSQAKKICPNAIILPSDYETYSLFSVRIFEILRRFSPIVEEYSIDEAFVDLTGLRRKYHGPYGEIAANIQKTITRELGLSVSVGVSISKVLAKVASKHKKPAGLTVIPGKEIHHYLAKLPIEEVWGIGANTSAFLKKFGIFTALDFARRDEGFVRKNLSKPFYEVWNELRGISVYPVINEERHDYQSISKTKTFTPPSGDEEFVFAQLSKNLENACIKARRHHLAAGRIIIFLREKNFKDRAVELKLSRHSAYPSELMNILREGFLYLYKKGKLYRSTGVVLASLVPEASIQYTLFDDVSKIEKMARVYSAVDELSSKFGKHTVTHCSSLPAHKRQHKGDRGDIALRKKVIFKGENKRQHIGIPVFNLKI